MEAFHGKNGSSDVSHDKFIFGYPEIFALDPDALLLSIRNPGITKNRELALSRGSRNQPSVLFANDVCVPFKSLVGSETPGESVSVKSED